MRKEAIRHKRDFCTGNDMNAMLAVFIRVVKAGKILINKPNDSYVCISPNNDMLVRALIS